MKVLVNIPPRAHATITCEAGVNPGSVTIDKVNTFTTDAHGGLTVSNLQGTLAMFAPGHWESVRKIDE